ncbi:MAG TPA: LysR substrate-binding domain-containing protein, partial [Pseudorhodoferax sp.]|nr:LysR substrate-binding domain-containing protein [Pseudorhodoferax sp.]
ISHQVRELEEVFGKPLFVRLHRRVELTPEGRRLASGLSRVLDALEASCAEVSLAPSGQVLSLYCAPTFAVKWLGPRLADFAKVHPGLTIRMTSGAEPMDLMRAREVDVAISYGMALQRPGVEVTPLGKESIAPLCSPALMACGGSAADILSNQTLIDSLLSHVTWRDWFALNGMPLPSRIRQSFDRAALSIAAAVDGIGIALESTRLAEREIARGELVELRDKHFKRVLRETHFLSLRTNERHTDKVKRFRTWIIGQLSAKP